ncbi:MAG TPA: ABC transporter ATP-binding protein, partial [Solirubrobacteraceae bacterium]|nr:ABC transporter ATP-binding protein [Solirubrobacteraceae bacterium]
LTVLFVTHDVEEAVYVSDRVAVMTNRPGRIKTEIAVQLPRPRSYDMVGTPEFAAIEGEVIESIRSESLAAANLEGAIS